MLDRNLHSPVHYPGDCGFIPQPLAEDGDPLEILI
jgi:inorganic pyrophosphatase